MQKLFILIIGFCFTVLFFSPQRSLQVEQIVNKGKELREDGPAEFRKFHHGIRTPVGKTTPGYAAGYRVKEMLLAKARARVSAARTASNGVIEWNERGPANVPGRTRGIVVDPDDPQGNTWYVGSVSGGVWKTTNGGQSWTLITPELQNLATSVVVMAESNPNIMFIGTGEGFFNLDAVTGQGIYKSTDRGATWTLLPSTVDFEDVNRMAIDPANADIVLAATASGMYRSTNGGNSWTQVADDFFQDLKTTPGNFNIMYATSLDREVVKSMDGGVTWMRSATGIGVADRIEVAISPINVNRIFASVDIGFGIDSEMYVSDDAGETWDIVDIQLGGVELDFLDGQGWYDNTIMCDPFNEDVIYFGGVDLFRATIADNSSTVDFYDFDESETEDLIGLVNFSADAAGGRLDVGPAADQVDIEIRFGPGRQQKAHRFLVPAGTTSGVSAADYTYQDYVDVPFEVWDVTNNRQLMASFRDQGRDGAFNLIAANTTSTVATEQSREYLYIHDVDYSAAASNASIAQNGGQESNYMFFFWPTLADGASWPFTTNVALRIDYEQIALREATTTFLTDGRNQYGTAINANVHVDHHNLVAIPMTATTYKIVNANDGGVFVSNIGTNPGTANNTWTSPGAGLNTTQFYGADKRPGADQYLGGTQDNGTWYSVSNQSASATSAYVNAIGGDGFEALWNNNNDQLMIGGAQFAFFLRSTNAGLTWTEATAGLTGDFPFISKLSNSKYYPDRIFTVGSEGVFVSDNFGGNWTLTAINDSWGSGNTFVDVEVSRANADIVWAGEGMDSNRKLHVSTDGGKTFNASINYTDVDLGTITRLGSHPTEGNTAFALFSFSGRPKILRTTDLGETWEDISGFGTNDNSSRGFPDVAVYCIYVRPDDPNIIWAGTEIGIVESLDNGQSWTLLDDFPNVSVWDMKGLDNQIVIATHGRGIWTATVDQVQLPPVVLPEIIAHGTTPAEELAIRVSATNNYDSIIFLLNAQRLGKVEGVEAGELDITISGISPGNFNVGMVAYIDGAPFQATAYNAELLNLLNVVESYSNYFSSLSSISTNLTLQSYSDVPTSQRRNLQTPHPYANNTTYSIFVRNPIKINSNGKATYRDVALVEPINDFVIVEATENGLDWLPLTAPYGASLEAAWLAAFNGNQDGTASLLITQEVDLLSSFAQNDTILFRMRMTSNASVTGWGWGVDFIAIQEEPTAVEPTPAATSVSFYPNPTKGDFQISYKLDMATPVVTQIFDTNGRLVLSREQNKVAGVHTDDVSLSGNQPGAYVVVLHTGKAKQVSKVILQQ